MSTPTLRRSERTMAPEKSLRVLEGGYSGRLATMGADGYPYCVPLLYVWMDSCVFLHGTIARGHLRSNIEFNNRACFEINENDGVFDYGRFECDSGLAFRSVILFGTVTIVDDRSIKQRFCEALMVKYGKPNTTRPIGFFPRLGEIAVYRFVVDRMSGKEQALPPLSMQWPNVDNTKTPNASPLS